MNTADKILADLITKASAGLDSAIEFSKTQIPDVIHQLLIWNAASSILWQVVSLLIVLALSRVIYKVRHSKDTDTDTVAVITIVLGIGILIFSIILLCNFDWLKIWLAPKVYLIEYAANLLSNK